MSDATYDELDDLRGTGAARVVALDGSVVSLYTDGRWRNHEGAIIPLDAHGPWVIIQRHKAGM